MFRGGGGIITTYNLSRILAQIQMPKIKRVIKHFLRRIEERIKNYYYVQPIRLGFGFFPGFSFTLLAVGGGGEVGKALDS